MGIELHHALPGVGSRRGCAALSICPEAARRHRALAGLDPVDLAADRASVFWGLVRTPADQRDMRAIQNATNDVAALWRIVDNHLGSRAYMEGGEFSLADLALATYARRWFGVEGVEKPQLGHLERWYRQCSDRAGFKTYVAPPLS